MLRLFLLCSLFSVYFAQAQQNHYTAPTDSLVINKLAGWQDWKFGLLMHWGTYSQWGVVESWSICPEDEGWTQRDSIHGKTYEAYKKNYESLQHSFNPIQFDPARWAAAAKHAGMKYVIFTTKHHDGFCMFDTRQTDYKISSPNTPFSSHPRANIAAEIFNAFRKEGLATGAYFSKPDWHNENYWWPYFPPKDRNTNYDPKKYPQRWEAFKQFTYNQIEELMSGYGKMDILWLDGGWVRPANSIDTSVEWERGITFEQDIDMAKIAGMARRYQPGLLIVDRSVGGVYENYTTPEQQIPDHLLSYPWETCMTMAGSWSHVPGDTYKTTASLIQTLIKIVARGGNLLLNIGPDAQGRWDDTAYARLQEIGDWMNINGESIYNTKPLMDQVHPATLMTISNTGNSAYIFLMQDPADPIALEIDQPALKKFTKAEILGTKTRLAFKKQGNQIMIHSSPIKNAGKYAIVIKCS